MQEDDGGDDEAAEGGQVDLFGRVSVSSPGADDDHNRDTEADRGLEESSPCTH